MKTDEKYMRRALHLARNGEGRVSPNPMVGAVIVHSDRIIGEGFHAFYGGPHAEVNAINSVKPEDRHLLKQSTIYVTLEPCSHYGKTPPCANLILNTGIPRVVVGCSDPNPKVAGMGIKTLEKAGIETTVGILEEECKELNRKFMKAQLTGLPWITLKWAQSADGFMAGVNSEGKAQPEKFSSSLSSVWVHRLRASHDAIIVGSNTMKTDNPRLNTRLWCGKSPEKFVFHRETDILLMLKNMKENGITSLLVEGGPTLLSVFIADGWYDEIRVETSPKKITKGLPSPKLPYDIILADSFHCRDNLIQIFLKKP